MRELVNCEQILEDVQVFCRYIFESKDEISV